MGATKTLQYSFHELQSAKLAGALAHPARMRILHIIHKRDFVRNVDLIADLKLSKSTVHDHI